MQRRNVVTLGILVVTGLFMAGCEQSIRGAAVEGSAGQVVGTKIEPIPGSELNRLTLSAKAAGRLDIQAGQVAERQVTRAGTTSLRKVVPYSAVLYDSNSNTWVYTNPQPFVYVRQSIKIDYFDGDHAIILDGPDVGTAVVTAGAAELFGTEFETGD
jgi:hypothetical protein